MVKLLVVIPASGAYKATLDRLDVHVYDYHQEEIRSGLDEGLQAGSKESLRKLATENRLVVLSCGPIASTEDNEAGRISSLLHSYGIAHQRLIAVSQAPEDIRKSLFSDSSKKLTLVPISKVKATKTEWLIPNLIPKATYCVLAGSGGSGKSSFIAALAAGLSKGLWGSPSRVLIISIEDPPEQVTKPKLAICGANLDLVEVLENGNESSFTLDRIPELLALVLKEKTTGKPFDLVVIDPLARLAKGTQLNDSSGIEPIAAALTNFAKETGAAVLLACHTKKKNKESFRDAESISGSAGIVNLARCGLLLETLKDGRRFLGVVKGNYGPNVALEIRQRELTPEEETLLNSNDPEILEAARSISAKPLEWTDPVRVTDFDSYLKEQEFGADAYSDQQILDAVVKLLQAFPIQHDKLGELLGTVTASKGQTTQVKDFLWKLARSGKPKGIRIGYDKGSKRWLYTPIAGTVFPAGFDLEVAPETLSTKLEEILTSTPEEKHQKWNSAWEVPQRG